MVKSFVSTAALVACGIIVSVVAVPHDAAFDLAARDPTTVTVTVTTCPEAGSTYPPGSVISSGPVGTPYGSETSITSVGPPPGYSVSSVATSTEISSTGITDTPVIPPATTNPGPTVVKTTPTVTSMKTTPITSSIVSSASSSQISTTESASASIPPAVGVAGKINIHTGVLMALAIGALI